MTITIHKDDQAVDAFAASMKLKLAAARDKGRSGWEDKELCSGEYLAQNLVAHLSRGNAGTFEDIANFAMMLHQRGESPALLKTQVDLNARVLAQSTLNKVADKWAAELTEKTEISQAHLDTDNRTNGERLADAIYTDVMSDPALQSLMAAEFKISALTADLLAVTTERDALAAQVGKLMQISTKEALDYQKLINQMREFYGVLYGSPTQCLAAHDAEVRTKAVEDAWSALSSSFDFGLYNAKLGLVDDLDVFFTEHVARLKAKAGAA
ncbi:MAG: hypothetical protein K2W88_18735 [Pararheinheimera sp.]|nr:hypothetical protein [Rheinheimera sp.]